MSAIAGVPGRVAVSPDSTQVLFEMVTDTPSFLETVSFRFATAWVVNIDGSNLRQIATASRPDEPDSDLDDPQVNAPAWSPDGSTFLLTENYASGGKRTAGYERTDQPWLDSHTLYNGCERR